MSLDSDTKDEEFEEFGKIVRSGSEGPVLFIDDIPDEFSGKTLEEIQHNAQKAIQPTKKDKPIFWKRWIRRAGQALTRLGS